MDTNRVKVLCELGLELQNSEPDKAIQYVDEGLKLSIKLKYKKGEGFCLNRIGVLYENKGDFAKSLMYLSQSLSIRKKIGDPVSIASTMHNIGIAYENIGMYDSALHYYVEDARIKEKFTDKRDLAGSYIGIGSINDIEGNFQTSLKYYRQALLIYSSYKDSAGTSIAYENIGDVHKNMNSNDSALFYYFKSARILNNMNNLAELANIYNNIGAVYEEKHKYQDASNYFIKSLKLHSQLGNQQGITEVNANIGVLFQSQGKFDIALKYYLVALDTAKKIKARESLLLINRNMAEIYFNQKKYLEAYSYFKSYSDLNDTLSNEQKNKKISELQIKYETDKNLRQIAAEKEIGAQRARERNILLVSTILILLLSIVIIYNYKQKINANSLIAKKNEEINSQKINVLLTEQDIKFASALIEGQEQERKRIAEDLHDRLGILLSTIKLHFSAINSDIKSKIWPSIKQSTIAEKLLDDAFVEVRQIAHDLASGTLTKSGLVVTLKDLKIAIEHSRRIKFNLDTYHMEERFDSQIEITIYRTLQELIGNALKHAAASEITVSLNRYDKELNIIVEDNGIGFNKSLAYASDGIGLKNVETRMKSIGGELTIDSLPEKGSTIIINVPLS